MPFRYRQLTLEVFPSSLELVDVLIASHRHTGRQSLEAKGRKHGSDDSAARAALPPASAKGRYTYLLPSEAAAESIERQDTMKLSSVLRRDERLHPRAIRVMHWTNAAAMIVMIWSGWGIYDDSVIFNFLHFPRPIVLGNGPSYCLLWHFAGMWLLMVNGAAHLVYGIATGRFRRRLLPIRLANVLQTLRETLHLKLAHDDLTTYNAVQKILYIGVILAGVAQVVTGLTLWQAVQLSSIMTLLGGFQNVRFLHFAGMAVIVSFLLVHIALALTVPRTLWFMLSGGPHVGAREAGQQ